MLHMSPSTEFTMPCQSAMGTILGFHPSVVTSPARDRVTRVYTHPRVGEESNRNVRPGSHEVNHRDFDAQKLPVARTFSVNRP